MASTRSNNNRSAGIEVDSYFDPTSPLVARRAAGLEHRTSLPRTPSIGASVASSSSSARRSRRVARYISFLVAVLSALCGNSIAVFSLYAPVLHHRLRYNQFQVNGLASAASLAAYGPIPVLGYICDRVGPTPLSIFGTILVSLGYGGAALIFRSVYISYDAGEKDGDHMVRATYSLLIAAFVAIGIGSSALYVNTIAVTAKNFGKSRYRGLALSVPITCFGLSAMWLSQFGSRVLYERNPDGTRGDVDVFRFFSILAVLMLIVGTLCSFFLKVVDEDELIDEAVEQLTASGILDATTTSPTRQTHTYGSLDEYPPVGSQRNFGSEAAEVPQEDERQFKKNVLLNAETRAFVLDHTMWCLTIAFFLIIGPGEAFINNMGTILGTLSSPLVLNMLNGHMETSAATHVSIVALLSTVARVVGGLLSDLLAPNPITEHPQAQANPEATRYETNDVEEPLVRDGLVVRRGRCSRTTLLILFSLVMSLGFLTLATGAMQEHSERFWIISSLVGFGYGGVFSMMPIIITIIWGVENFATNWGAIAIFPALGSITWGFIYSAVYERGAKHLENYNNDNNQELFCHGTKCYASTFWAMAGSVWIGCLLLLWAWKGTNGWAQRKVVV